MSDVEITCKPRAGILRVSADLIAHLDHFAQQLPTDSPWQVDVLIGHTPTDTVHLTARPATDQSKEDDAA